MQKRQILTLLSRYGDAIVEERGKEPSCCTTDFNNKYIKKIRRTEHFSLKGAVLVFDWTLNEFRALKVEDVKRVEPLAGILQNIGDELNG